MTFSQKITCTPLPFDPEMASEALRHLPWATGPTKDLLAGTAGCSPYLAGLMARHGDWLEEVMDTDPEAALDSVLDGVTPGSHAETPVALRLAKQKVSLLVALADLGGVWTLEEVTGGLSRFADRALDAALKTALLPDLSRGKFPGQTADDIKDAAGLVAIAMGKMGAGELNYSSDIDLICLFDDQRFDPEDVGTVRTLQAKAVRRAMSYLSDLTGDGYVFRTDLRLRPDPSATPVAISVSAAERYYEALGRTWERAAFVKARPAAGAIAVGRRFLKDIRPFIWRRHLDFTTVQDIQDILQKIRDHKGQYDTDILDGRNVKLCRGGIREIEFFTQTQQLIAGGRDKSLRMRGTRAGLQGLAEKGWITSEIATELSRDYGRLRDLEHRAQMIQDTQTHHLPQTDAGWQRMAMFLGADDVPALQAELRELFHRVHELTESFFTPSPAQKPETEISETTSTLIARWRAYPALRSRRAQGLFDRVLPRLLQGFEKAANKDEAIVQFDGFLKGLPAGVQVFSLFDANPQLIDLMVDISSTSPALAVYLGAHPEVLDAVIGGAFFQHWPGREALTADLTARLSDPDLDFERKLDTARAWKKDWHFRIGVHQLRGLIGTAQAFEEYSDLAEAVLAAMWTVICDEFARKHGPLPGRGAVVLGMGSLGARQLNARSDLDLIMIYDAPADAESVGPKPLPSRTYYARLTKALVTGLSVQTAGGTLYEVDMRLRPSGRQGPAAASWTAFQSYQQTDAWTWEHLALTRARPMAGDASLAADIDAFRETVLAAPRLREDVFRDLSEMRARLAAAKPRRGNWDFAAGAGGLQDVELFAQAMALLAGSPCRTVEDQLALDCEGVSAEDRAALLSAHQIFSAIKLSARLLTDQPLNPDALGQGGRDVLLHETGQDSLAALEAMLTERTEAAAAVINRVLAPPS
ncbi:glutamine-synthetase adenylyltransferase [Pseudoruegeria sp. SK021]|uniref:[protein-PII] uridylyltransferase family protein n=1 Tax=Pseudoruegeria sp. SK021 TaxID=1933035 RepID=UPI000A216937|nr:glutamine-synthetase adenylyltransferase [Pseudoruegeria sp. SK021]OSP55243.1 glutamine-synthetase adenylyltransferase [Pseudoruegeria sp. SK021]